jgi:hypothetical protein
LLKIKADVSRKSKSKGARRLVRTLTVGELVDNVRVPSLREGQQRDPRLQCVERVGHRNRHRSG